MRVKICGITRPEDAVAAEQAGADALGFIFVESSKRFVGVAQAAAISSAVGPLIHRVGVFADSSLEKVVETASALRLHAVQLHGQEDAEFAAEVRKQFWVIKAVSFHRGLSRAELDAFPADALLLDGIKPGSGEVFAWEDAAFLKGYPRLILAGGLTPDNVAAGIEALEPYAVDVSSGVEARPGVKDAQKIQDFVRVANLTKLSTVIHR